MMVDSMDIGVCIDRSHGSALDLDLAIITYAMNVAGYELDSDYPYSQDGMDDGDYAEIVRDYADRAVDYLNHKCAGEDVVFIVEDNSLYLTLVDGE